MLTLADIFEALTGVRPDWAAQRLSAEVITEATVDSRQAIPGSLFVALPGERADGHDYLAKAFARGAVIGLIQRDVADDLAVIDIRNGFEPGMLSGLNGPFCIRVEDSLKSLQAVARFWRRKLPVKVIGITGSVGKSTTKELIAEVLGQRYRTLKNPGNLNNEIGLPLTLLSLSEGHERAVLEMGFYVPGEIAFLCDLALPEIAVLTNIGTVHAERAGSVEAIARGKAELVQSLPATGVAILNYDDERVREMAIKTRAQVFFYGLEPQADLWGDEVEGLGLEGIRFQMHYRGETLHLRVPMIGQHSVHTALRAAAVGLADGLTWQEIVDGLHSTTTQLRLVAVRTASGALILDDTYNASPESVLAALNLLNDLGSIPSAGAVRGELREAPGRKVAVLGDMLELGAYEWQGHEMIGMRAAAVVDELVTVGERGRMIAAAASRAGLSNRQIKDFENNQQVIEYLQVRLRENDVVLVKGSHGMRMDRIVAALEARA